MNGIKISSNGNIDSATLSEFAVDSEHALWMCDLKRRPKHYGLLKATVTSIGAFSKRTLLTINHEYTNTPSFITQWYYPAGTAPASSSNQTYGIGSLEALPGVGVVKFTAKVTPTQFMIFCDNSSNASSLTNLYAEFRYYIFAQPLSVDIQIS